MRIMIRGVHYKYHWLTSKEVGPVLVCLHGFMGTGASFSSVFSNQFMFRVLVIDLLGHGKTDSCVEPERYGMEETIEDLRELMKQLGISRFYLLGYSMGARVALGWALTDPEAVKGLVLESGSPGLLDEKARGSRKKLDKQRAELLQTVGITEFVDQWEKLPLFLSQIQLEASVRRKIREERLSQSVVGLSRSLIYLGTGNQPEYWTMLATLSMPTLYLAGGLDRKFVKIGKEMSKHTKKIIVQVVPEVGHCVHIEKPMIFAHIVQSWINELEVKDPVYPICSAADDRIAPETRI